MGRAPDLGLKTTPKCGLGDRVANFPQNATGHPPRNHREYREMASTVFWVADLATASQFDPDRVIEAVVPVLKPAGERIFREVDEIVAVAASEANVRCAEP